MIFLDDLFKDGQGKEMLFKEVMIEMKGMSESSPLFYSGNALEQAVKECFGDVEFYLIS